MINIVVYSTLPAEIQCLRRLLSAYSFQNSWADCQVSAVSDVRKLDGMDQKVDILIFDVSQPAAVAFLKEKKRQYPPVLIFPIAGPDVPPTSYVCPEIMPYGLFWRPVSQESATPVVEQMMACVHHQIIPPSQSSFRITGKQKTQDIPFSSILYFEAREKKIALRMQEDELLFSSTLSQLEEELPAEFIRCHKSFLVNRRHILSVDRSNSSIVLDNRMELPISRSYKKSFWEAFQNGG